MNIELMKWNLNLQDELMKVCNEVDREYLSNRLPFPYTREDAIWWLSRVEKQDGKNGVFRAIVVDGKVVGSISVEQKEDVFCRDGEIGYMLLDEYKGNGIMSKAVKEICDLAFMELNLLRITALVYEPHIASIRVLLKNGFVQEGIQKRAVYKNGNIYDLSLLGKVK